MEEKDNCHLRIIGDVHGERTSYLRILERNAPFTLQIGDLDFDYNYLITQKVDEKRNRFLGGNHDNYDTISSVPHSLGDYGVWSVPDFGDIFFLRGAWSIDHRARVTENVVLHGRVVRHKDMWLEEELDLADCYKALDLYKEVKPKMVVTHSAPHNVIQYVTNPAMTRSWGHDDVIKTRTSELLQVMTEFHQPRIHVFGHYHTHFDKYVNGVTGELMPEGSDETKYTRYVCVDILKTLDLPKNFVNNL